MEFVIVRQEKKAWGIDGHLYINRQRVCDTVEHPTRHLPQGEYMIRPSAICRQHLDRSIPQPFRHGDGAMRSLKGEIIVGKRLLSGVVTESQPIYDRLYERLKKAFQRGNTVRLKIVG